MNVHNISILVETEANKCNNSLSETNNANETDSGDKINEMSPMKYFATLKDSAITKNTGGKR